MDSLEETAPTEYTAGSYSFRTGTGRTGRTGTGNPSRSAMSKVISEKDEDDMYPMSVLPFNQRDIKDRHESVRAPLTLFAPFPHEDLIPRDEGIEMERPVTPIDEEIKIQPMHFNQLAKYVRRRVAAKTEILHLSTEEQQSLGGILMGEVNGIWPDIRRQIDDPFLTPEENKELNRRIAVHIVTVCEQLFKHYVSKAQILNKRGVFSGPANMSRLKAQLALDANKFLNVLTIRRYIVADIRGQLKAETDSSAESSDHEFIYAKKPPIPKQPVEKMSYKGMIQASRPKSKSKKYRFRTVEEDLMEIQSEMPNLDTRKLATLVHNLPSPRSDISEKDNIYETEEMKKKVKIQETIEAFSSMFHKEIHSHRSKRRSFPDIMLFPRIDEVKNKVLLKRSNSLPQLGHESLADELNLDEADLAGLAKEIIEGIDVYKKDRQIEMQKREQLQPGTRAYVEDDLKKLSCRPKDSELETEEDLPPLLQALTTSKKNDARKAELEKKLKEMEERQRIKSAKENIPLKAPTHPQPSTVPTTLPNKMVVRASDIRVSNRTCLSTITIKQNSTVYNDLLDEIDPASIKHLDRNLFLGSEVKEVYREIMKTVPSDHLDLELDPGGLIEKCADSVNISQAIASSTLMRSKKKNRIVNVNIQKKENPPWQGENVREWVKTAYPEGADPFHSILSSDSPSFVYLSACGEYPIYTSQAVLTVAKFPGPHSTLKDTKGNVAVDPMDIGENFTGISTPDLHRIGKSNKPETPSNNNLGIDIKLVIPGVGLVEDLPPMVAERMSRSYNSWLQWWKNTINYDDYLKYLSNKESDYLAAVFHFYNSEDEEEEDERSPSVIEAMKRKEEEEIEHEKKLEELRSQKTEFTPGMWNVNAVLLGGLGKDPSLPDDGNRTKTSLTVDSTNSSSKKKTLQDLISERLTTREDSISRNTTELKPLRGTATSRAYSKMTTTSSPRKSKQTQSGTLLEDEDPISPQEKLESIWNMLKMPDSQKLDMAIKYSSDEFISKLQQAIGAWQTAADLIVHREAIMASLEKFERLASDPNRFFERGHRGSSVARLEEARQRSILYRKIEAVSGDVKKAVEHVRDQFNDMMTYQGRPYLEKMHWDRTEMLYWLSEERRQQALEHEAFLREVPLKVAQLAPLPMN